MTTDTMTTRAGIKCVFRRGASDGVEATLYVAGFTDSQIEQAKREVRKHRDVIMFRLTHQDRPGEVEAVPPRP